MESILRLSLLLLFLTIPAAAAAAQDAAPPGDPGPVLELDELISRVLQQNQDLAAYQSDRLAAAERAAASGAFPNPSVGVAIRSLPVPSFSFTEDMMTMSEVMVRQQIPWFGKQGLRRDAKGKFVEVSDAEAGALRLSLAEAVTAAYSELWLATASREVIEQKERALQRLAFLAQSRLASGGARQAEVLRAELELSRIALPFQDLEEREAAARATLGALLAAELPLGGTPSLPVLAALPPQPSLMERLSHHPELLALERREEQARLEARLAAKEKWPDPEIGLAYGVRVGAPDMIGAEVMIPLPLFAGTNQDRQAAAARADAEAIARRRTARRATLAGELRAAWAGIRLQEERLSHFETELIPQARRSVEAALGAYQAGGVDYLAVLDAELQRFGQELEALEAKASLLRGRARLARAAGSIETLFNSSADGAEHE